MASIVSNLFNKMSNVTHVVHVTTGDRRGAGTDANVWLIFKDSEGNVSGEHKLDNWFKNDHERGKTSIFRIRDEDHVGSVTEIEIWRDATGIAAAWLVDRVEIEHVLMDGKKHVFPIHRWIKAHMKYSIRMYDCYLPQDSHNSEQRAKELEEMRKVYDYVIHIKGGPAQIKELPEDERFAGRDAFDIIFLKHLSSAKSKIVGWTLAGDWKCIEDIKKLYKYTNTVLGRKEPYSLTDWCSDKWFGLQRLQGCNPTLIKLCTEIPERFGVTEELVASFLEGMTLTEALNAKKLFIIDLQMLKNITCRPGSEICSPLALFYLNKDGDLLPIAIQLFQEKGPQNPVFTPEDPKYTWLLAKWHYNNADATHHQGFTHLGFTHLIMEGFVICTHRHLSISHPIFRLLAPHFLYLLAINTRGIQKLVSKDGWVDATMTSGRIGLFEVIARGLQIWRLDVHGTIPKEIESRGVSSPEVLPHYPYRDDSVAIFNAIREYVTEIVNHYYKSKEDIEQDFELKNWRDEMVLSRENGGLGILGVPGNEKGFETTEDIVATVTAIISTCSISHAASNFQQYDEYAFPPNYPATLFGEIPRDKTERSESEVLKYLPRKGTTLAIMVITNLLSNQGTNRLGDFEVKYLYDPVAVQAAEKFHAKLDDISEAIQQRNANSSKFQYSWLDPKNIPNSISI